MLDDEARARKEAYGWAVDVATELWRSLVEYRFDDVTDEPTDTVVYRLNAGPSIVRVIITGDQTTAWAFHPVNASSVRVVLTSSPLAQTQLLDESLDTGQGALERDQAQAALDLYTS